MDAQSERAAVAKPKRRWFQFSLASLLALVLVCAIGLATIDARAKRQHRAVDYIEGLKGGVDFAADDGWKERAREWLAPLLGEDYFLSITAVHLGGSGVSDEGLVHLKGVTGLTMLFLADTQIGDAGLAELEGLTALTMLDLYGTQVSDAGLVHLRRLEALEMLDLSDTNVSDAGLARLQGLTALEYLDLSGSQVSDLGLAHLMGMSGLDTLDLCNTQVSDAGVAELRRALPNCDIFH